MSLLLRGTGWQIQESQSESGEGPAHSHHSLACRWHTFWPNVRQFRGHIFIIYQSSLTCLKADFLQCYSSIWQELFRAAFRSNSFFEVAAFWHILSLLLVYQSIIDGSLGGISPSALPRLGVLMDITKFGAEKSFGMVLDIQKCPWSPGGAVFRIVVEVRAVTTESFRRIQKIEKESALDICQPDICLRTFTTS